MGCECVVLSQSLKLLKLLRRWMTQQSLDRIHYA